MAQVVVRFQISAKINWRVTREPHAQRWIGVCDPLKVTAEAETWAELCQVINEIHNELFRDLLEEGQLEQFLRQHGWKPVAPLPSRTANVVFDIPAYMIPAAANGETRAVHQ
jgi:predicted nucleic acid-binding protein